MREDSIPSTIPEDDETAAYPTASWALSFQPLYTHILLSKEGRKGVIRSVESKRRPTENTKSLKLTPSLPYRPHTHSVPGVLPGYSGNKNLRASALTRATPLGDISDRHLTNVLMLVSASLRAISAHQAQHPGLSEQISAAL